jgi:hypothetical protein
VNQILFRSAVIPSREELGKVADQTRQNFTPRKSALTNSNIAQPANGLAPDSRPTATGSVIGSRGEGDSTQSQNPMNSQGDQPPARGTPDPQVDDSGQAAAVNPTQNKSSPAPEPAGSGGDDS